jgi:pyridoxamine 5'-phosphate oxidase
MTDDTFRRIREEYSGPPLTEDSADRDPVAQFGRWFQEAVDAGVRVANGATLATVDPDGQPAARVVLLKSFDHRGFVFYSNYDSRKGRALAANPRAALCFWWQPLDRQARIEGVVSRVSAEESDEYWHSRPRASNLGALASRQSAVLRDRAELEQAAASLEEAWRDRPLERPRGWGGYRLMPRAVELWQGRADRLHDRLRYRLDDTLVWRLERLAP